MKIFFLMSLITISSFSHADCEEPKTSTFGRVIAICGNENIVYAGTERLDLLGVKVVSPLFELEGCQSGRRRLSIQTHSEGFDMSLVETDVLEYSEQTGAPVLTQRINIGHSWGTFKMTAELSNGTKKSIECKAYKDNRTNIEYLE